MLFDQNESHVTGIFFHEPTSCATSLRKSSLLIAEAKLRGQKPRRDEGERKRQYRREIRADEA